MVFRKKQEAFSFLHGFLGSPFDWQETINFFNNVNTSHKYTLYPINLDKILKSFPLPDYNLVTNKLLKLINTEQKSSIIGYSLGSRVALHSVIQNPFLFNKVVLISCSPGIEDPDQRAERSILDLQLSERILLNFEDFLNYWYSSNVFTTLNEMQRKYLIESRLKNCDPTTQSKIIEAMSPGIQISLWKDIEKINSNPNLKTLIIYGEHDAKYKEISIKMHGIIKNSQLECIKNAGHIPHFENFPDFINIVNKFLMLS